MLLILNHKANLTFDKIKKYEKIIRKYDLIIMPTLCYLSYFNKGKYILGSQDISEYNKKEIAGEINGTQLKSLNVKYCLVGHSERRIYKKENYETLNNKIKECLNNDIIPLYCIGETENNINILKEQIDVVLKNLNNEKIYIVYEPVKNIGTKNPNLKDLKNKIIFIKSYIKDNYNKEIEIIYGGGVNLSNIKELKKIKEISGLIISSDSLKIENLKKLYKETKQ